jgi:hypothetical protein
VVKFSSSEVVKAARTLGFGSPVRVLLSMTRRSGAPGRMNQRGSFLIAFVSSHQDTPAVCDATEAHGRTSRRVDQGFVENFKEEGF